MNDTNYYRQALAEFHEKNPQMRRATDLTPALLSSILRRAQELKDAAKVSPEIDESEMERARR